MSELPKGWISCSIFDLCTPKQWKTIPTDALLDNGYVVYGANGIIGKYDQYTHEQPTVMITCRGATCGNVHISQPFSYINGNAMALDNLCIVDLKYIFYYLKGYKFDRIISGSAQPQITQQGMKGLIVQLAPQAEQTRIVEKLDEVLAQVDTIKARLDGIPSILKRFRQSVLAAAVSGRLTEDWRTDNPGKCREVLGEIRKYQRKVWEKLELQKFSAKNQLPKNDKWKEKYQEPSIEDDVELIDLPSSWGWGTWEDILDHSNAPFKRGPFGSALTKSIFVDKGYKVYEQYCPINDDCSYARYFITEEKFQELKAFDVRSMDFLISCSGTIGRITQVPDSAEAGVINQALLRVRIDTNIYDSNFFIKLFRSEYFQNKLIDSSTGSAIPNVKGVKELKAIPVPIMTIDEQKEIVRLVDQYFAFADTIEAQVKKAQARVDNLTQSILAKAFRGELVAQDPDDEPAEKLLERIALARKEAEALAKAAKKVAKTK